MNIKTVLIITASAIRASHVFSQTTGTPSIEVVAREYGDKSRSVVADYQRILGGDVDKALEAVDSLEAKQAYSALALALPTANLSLRSAIIDVLIKAKTPNPIIVRSVSAELARLNTVVIRQGGEKIAGLHVMKQKCVRIIANQTGQVTNQVNVDDPQQVVELLETMKSKSQ